MSRNKVQNDGERDLNSSIDKMVSSFSRLEGLLIDLLDERARRDLPSTMYGGRKSVDESHNYLLKFNGLFNRALESTVGKTLGNALDSAKRNIEYKTKKRDGNREKVKESRKEFQELTKELLNLKRSIASLTDSVEDQTKRIELEGKREAAKKRQASLQEFVHKANIENKAYTHDINEHSSDISLIQSNPKVFWEKQRQKTEKALEEEWEHINPYEKATKYRNNFNKYKSAKAKEADFESRRAARDEASRMVAYSGFGNTTVGRIMQGMIGANDTVQNLFRFTDNMISGDGFGTLTEGMFGYRPGSLFKKLTPASSTGNVGVNAASKAANAGKAAEAANTASKAATVGRAATGAAEVGGAAAGAEAAAGGAAAGGAAAAGGGLMAAAAPVAAVVAAFVGVAMAAKELTVAFMQLRNSFYTSSADMYRAQHDAEVQAVNEMQQTAVMQAEQSGEMMVKKLDNMIQVSLRNLKLVADQRVNALDISTSLIAGANINETAYKAARAANAAAAEMLNIKALDTQLKGSIGNLGTYQGTLLTQRELQESANIQNALVARNLGVQQAAISAQTAIMDSPWANLFTNTSSQILNDNAYRFPSHLSGQRYANSHMVGPNVNADGPFTGYDRSFWFNVLGKWGLAVSAQDIQQNASAKLDFLTLNERFAASDAALQVSNAAQLASTAARYTMQAEDMKLNYEKQKLEIAIDEGKRLNEIMLNVAEKLEKYMIEYDDKANDLGISLGITNKKNLNEFKKTFLTTVAEVGKKWGKTYEEIIKTQSEYAESTGRNKNLSKSDFDSIYGLGGYLGDDKVAAEFAAEMEIFNHNATDSVDMIDKTIQHVNRIGLNGRKMMKDMMQNIKLAQKYSFKGGVAGLAKMAEWAQKTRFNLNNADSVISSIRDSNIEDVLKKTAEYQVLGGNAAIYSDPFGMLADAWGGDPQAYLERMQNMTRGAGTIDFSTGETTFDNIAENMWLHQLAKIQGRPIEDLYNEIRQRNKNEAVMRSLTDAQRRSFNQDQLDYLTASAHYDKKLGGFAVNMMGANGEVKPVPVNEIVGEMLNRVMPEEHNAQMRFYMQEVVSSLKIMSGESQYQQAHTAQQLIDQAQMEWETRINQAHDDYITKFDWFVEGVSKAMADATNAQKSYLEYAEQEENNMKKTMAMVNTQATTLATALSGLSSSVYAAASNIMNASSKIAADAATNEAVREQMRKEAEALDKKNNGTGLLTNTTKPPKREGWWDVTKQAMYIVSGAGTGLTGGLIGLSAAPVYHFMNAIDGLRDGFVSSNGKSSLINASNVTPINDGGIQLAATHPNDSGIFAKTGGPFDKLFNGVFGEISSVHGILEQSILPNSSKRIFSDNNSTPSKKDVNINMNGTLKLDSNGQSVDVVELLRNNPEFVRKITEIIINQMSMNENGGKSEMFSNRWYR